MDFDVDFDVSVILYCKNIANIASTGMPVIIIMEGTPPNAVDYGGHPAPTGPALPNLINAVRMLKSTPRRL
jgi:hypothetical protein